mgnify:CR=1 FL=1
MPINIMLYKLMTWENLESISVVLAKGLTSNPADIGARYEQN